MVVAPFEELFVFQLTVVDVKIMILRKVYTYNSKI